MLLLEKALQWNSQTFTMIHSPLAIYPHETEAPKSSSIRSLRLQNLLRASSVQCLASELHTVTSLLDVWFSLIMGIQKQTGKMPETVGSCIYLVIFCGAKPFYLVFLYTANFVNTLRGFAPSINHVLPLNPTLLVLQSKGLTPHCPCNSTNNSAVGFQ